MELLYIYDALCGWCYGFSPVLTRFNEKYGTQVPITVISGGMITGEREGPIGQVAAYINEAYKTVEARTGIQFGNAFLAETLKEGNALFSSVPPSLALTAFKKIQSENQLAFASRIQRAIYFEGAAPAEPALYGILAQEFGLDKDDFIALMQENDTIVSTQQEFALAAEFAQLGVSGFPSLILSHNEQLHLLAKGYISYDQLEEVFQKALKILS